MILEMGKRLYAKGLIVGTEGNISLRLKPNRFFITRSGAHKGFLKTSDVLIMDGNGNKMEGKGEVSSEKKFHLLIYHKRPEVNAIIHAHPPHAIACTLAGLSLEKPFLAETQVVLGSIPTVPYATPTTQDMVDGISQFLSKNKALLLEKHGAITLDKDLESAFSSMEILEQTAKILSIAKTLGEIKPLSQDEIRPLLKLLM